MIRTCTLALAVVVSISACDSSSPSPGPTSDGGTTSAWRAVVGDDGLVAQTFDGTTWTTRTMGAASLFSVACVGNYSGWVAGQAGYVAHTADGGKTWTAQASTLAADLHAIRFATTTVGVAAGDGGALAVTSDGGATWHVPVQAWASVALRSAAAANQPDLLLVAGDQGTVLRSADDGASWSAGTIPTTADLHGIAIDILGDVTYAVDVAGNVWRSDDRAVTFVLDAALGSSLEAVSVSDDGTRAIAAGAGGAVFVRSAAGWQRATVPTTVDLHAVLAENGATNLYAGGDQGVLLASDGNGSFHLVPLGTTSAIRGLEDL